MLAPPTLPLPIRAFNAAGRSLRALGLRHRLDPAELVRAARRKTGLSDFGDGPYLRELGILCDALEHEARLTAFGRFLVRQQLLLGLTTQLEVQDWFTRHPEIAQQKIERPIVIIGMPRTGTTILHELFALDPQIRVPESWEVAKPCPPPEAAGYVLDPRIKLMEKHLRSFEKVIPDVRRIHRMGARLPQECVGITGYVFIGMMYPVLFHIPTYARRQQGDADFAGAYRFHRRFLQLLQWRAPRSRWVLKSPGHLWSLKALIAEYPDACLVQTHRDPLKIESSNTSLTTVFRKMASDEIDPHGIAREWSEYLMYALNSSLGVRASGAIPVTQAMDVQFTDFMADPAAATREIYRRFGLAYPADMDAKIADYVRDNPADKHGKHSYHWEDTGLDYTAEREKARPYQEHFKVASEF